MFLEKENVSYGLDGRPHVLFTRFGVGVFDERWLDFRLNVFEKLTFPSVLAQNSRKFVWFIFVDSDAPKEFLDKLFSLVDEYEFVRLVKIDFYFNYFDIAMNICEEVLSKCGNVFVSKIDDDDLIHKNLFDSFYSEVGGEPNCVYTFPKGYEFLLQERVVLKCDRPFLTHNTFFKISDAKLLGIIRVGHHKIERYCFNNRMEVRKLQDKTPCYLYTRHKQSDSNFSSVKKEILNDELSVPVAGSIYEAFSINRSKYLELRGECRDFPSSSKQKTWNVNADLNKQAERTYKRLREIKEEIINNGSNVFD